MNINNINDFLAVASHDTDWDNCAPGMWVRSRKVEGWSHVPAYADPYDSMPVAVQMTPPHSTTEVMSIMYGYAVPVDYDTGEDEGEAERVRVIMYFHNGDQSVAVQFQGKMAEFSDNLGEGMFPEALLELRRQQKEEV